MSFERLPNLLRNGKASGFLDDSGLHPLVKYCVGKGDFPRLPNKMDYYEVLGVKRNALQADIRRAYRRLVLRFHPDQSRGSDSEKFRKVHEAYQVLCDPETRAAYDRTLGHEVPVRIISGSSSTKVEEVWPGDTGCQVKEIHRRQQFSREDREEWYRTLWQDLFFDL